MNTIHLLLGILVITVEAMNSTTPEPLGPKVKRFFQIEGKIYCNETSMRYLVTILRKGPQFSIPISELEPVDAVDTYIYVAIAKDFPKNSTTYDLQIKILHNCNEKRHVMEFKDDIGSFLPVERWTKIRHNIDLTVPEKEVGPSNLTMMWENRPF
ncbi:hypothetical protein CRE_00180 [Caenorhabditis remanei]|uniref:Uncharacterized protein n=2 Tax=Caenorhabditis remanei TaxID=31234 RepID=E3LDM2_CAERE|nr:hypothetical protein CRE_00180 [Caenorhabditis remanei]